MRAVGTRITIGLLDLARGRIAEVPVVAFTVGYARRLASAGDTGVTRLAHLIEFLYANALTVARIRGIFGRCIRTRRRITYRSDGVLGATSGTRANARISARLRSGYVTLVIRIRIAGDGPAIAVCTGPFLCRGTRLAFARAARATANTVDAITRIAFRVDIARRTFGFLNARLAGRLAQFRDAVVVPKARFADETLHRTNFATIDIGFGAVLQTVPARRRLAQILKAVAADAIDTDDATFAIGALLSAATAAIEIRFVAADLAVVRTTEEPVVEDQVAIVVDTVTLLGKKSRFGVRNAFRRSGSTERTLDLPLITRRTRVFRTETRITDARNAIVDTTVAIVVETVAQFDARKRLSGADSPVTVATRPLPRLASTDVQFLGRPRKTDLRGVVHAHARATRNTDVVDDAVAIVVDLPITRVRALGNDFTYASAELAIHALAFTRFARTNPLGTRRTRITRLRLPRRTLARRIGQTDVVDDAVAVIILGIADVRRRLDRSDTGPELLIAAARHRAALAFTLQIERTFDLFARIVHVTRFRVPGRALAKRSRCTDVVDVSVAIVIETIARINGGRKLLTNAFAPLAIFTNLLARFTRTFAQCIGRATITFQLFPVVTRQPLVNRTITIVVATVGNFLLGRYVAVAFAPRPLITTLKTIATKALAARTWRPGVTALELVRHARACVDVILVDQTIAIVINTVATGIRVVRLCHDRAIEHR